MKKVIPILALVTLLAAHIQAQYSSTSVQHPQLTWKYGSGTIESASVALTPNGAFMKYDVTMTFSARSVTAFLPNDSIEVTYRFELPAEAVVNDLYLWVGNEVSRGLILDRSIASSVYEGIVKRRRDPALLQKTSQTAYQLQIYPMAASGTRTVRFTFVAPLKRSGNTWNAAVPRNLFTPSLNTLPFIRTIYYAPSAGHIPVLANDNNYSFTAWLDSLNRPNTWKCDIPFSIFSAADPLITVPVPAAGPYLFTRFSGAQTGIYHVTLDPYSIFGIAKSRKVIVAFDYDSIKTTMTRPMYIEAVKTMLRTSYSSQDSFNIVFNSWQRSGDKWFAADSAGINAAFKTLGAYTIPNASDIPGLFMNIVEFMNMRGNAGAVILMAASDKFSVPSVADPALSWLESRFPKGVPVHIVNMMNRNYTYTYVYNQGGGVTTYSANGYFYDGIKAKTGGTVRAVTTDVALAGELNAVAVVALGELNSFDLSVRFENGFTYSKYSYGATPFTPLLASQTAGQIGMYAGSGPISIELGGFFEGKPYQKKLAVPDSAVVTADSSLRAIWVGKSIADVEWNYQSADVVKRIVDVCVAERVVCRYTALLALEPGDTLRIVKNDTPIRVTQAERPSVIPGSYAIASAFPNPFNPTTTLRVQLPQGARAQDVTLAIFNMLGQKVKTFDASGLSESAYKEFTWDATDDTGRRVASGMYLFVVTASGSRHTVKLMLLK